VNVRQASILFRVSEDTIRMLCQQGEFGAVSVKGRWTLKDPPCREQMIGLSAIAEALKVSVRWVEKLCKAGRVGAVRIGRFWRVPLSEATKLMLLRLGGFKK
jgi:excisionase family DNA binding protein